MDSQESTPDQSRAPAWFRRGAFLRDAATQVVAGVVIAAIVYMTGVAAGYFGAPKGESRVIAALVTLGVAAIIAVLVLLHVGSVQEMKRREPEKSQVWYGTWLGLLFLAMIAPLVATLVAFWGQV